MLLTTKPPKLPRKQTIREWAAENRWEVQSVHIKWSTTSTETYYECHLMSYSEPRYSVGYLRRTSRHESPQRFKSEKSAWAALRRLRAEKEEKRERERRAPIYLGD